jgi:hypothetical protein
MDEEQEFCRRENRSFPASDFYDDPDWGRVHKLVPVHTVGGTVLNQKSKVPEPDAAPPQPD